MNPSTRSLVLVTCLSTAATIVGLAQAPAPTPQPPVAAAPADPGRPLAVPARRGGGPPTRDPLASDYVKATELPDGAVPAVNVNGNFIIGPTHPASPAMLEQPGVPKGTVQTFTMASTDSKIYPGVARVAGGRGVEDPTNPAKLNLQNEPGPYTRRVAVYTPAGYAPGTIAPPSSAAMALTRCSSPRSTISSRPRRSRR